MTDAFFEPMSDDELQAWEGDDCSRAQVAETSTRTYRSSTRRTRGKRR